MNIHHLKLKGLKESTFKPPRTLTFETILDQVLKSWITSTLKSLITRIFEKHSFKSLFQVSEYYCNKVPKHLETQGTLFKWRLVWFKH